MAIVTSTHQLGPVQQDGRRYVTETHTDSIGNVYRREYGPVGAVNYAAIRDAYAVVLADQLAEAEAQALADDGV